MTPARNVARYERDEDGGQRWRSNARNFEAYSAGTIHCPQAVPAKKDFRRGEWFVPAVFSGRKPLPTEATPISSSALPNPQFEHRHQVTMFPTETFIHRRKLEGERWRSPSPSGQVTTCKTVFEDFGASRGSPLCSGLNVNHDDRREPHHIERICDQQIEVPELVAGV